MERNTQSALINSIMQIGHGNLSVYTQAVLPVEDPELLAHLVAYTAKGKIRDVKVALPALALHCALGLPDDSKRILAENAVAHMLLLPPRDLRRAAIYHDELKRAGHPTMAPGGRLLRRGVEAYLRLRESQPVWWIRTAVQDRHSLIWLYDHFHVKPSALAQQALFANCPPPGSTLALVRELRTMTPEAQAAAIQRARLPFVIAVGAVSKASDPVILRALIDAATGTEVVTHAKTFERLAKDDAACRGALDAALDRAARSDKTESLKASKVAPLVSGEMAARLQTVTEKSVEKQSKLDCNVLILADKSGSMQIAIEAGKTIAALIARRTSGKVMLVFFDTTPRAFDVTGLALADIAGLTSLVRAGGGTSIGCGVRHAQEHAFAADMIVILSDGGQNVEPAFMDAYRAYERKMGVSPSVTFLRLPGDTPDALTVTFGSISLTRYEFADKAVDSYNLPAIVDALRPGTYGLLDDVLATPLLRVADALAKTERMYA